jgi:DNA-binding response OmpR family regulator
MKILVVDDDSLITDLLECQLAEWGHEPVAFNKSVDALSTLSRDDAPRLAILDWEMPLISGPLICQKIRQKSGDRIYFILLTGNGGKGHVIEALRAGANDYIVKPFDPEDLKARIDAAVQVIEARPDYNCPKAA